MSLMLQEEVDGLQQDRERNEVATLQNAVDGGGPNPVVETLETHAPPIASSKCRGWSTDKNHTARADTLSFDASMVKVSIFRNCKSREHNGFCSLEHVLDKIKTELFRPEIEAVREAYAEGGKEAAGPLKQRLVAFTPSGTFERRANDALLQHSGVLVLDADDLEDVEAARQRVNNDQHTLFSFVSPTGTGLKVGVRMHADPKLHLATFLTLEKYYRENLDIEVDPSRKDVAGLCFISYDPELFYNPQALLLEPDLSLAANPKATKMATRKETPKKNTCAPRENTDEEVRVNVPKIQLALEFINPADLSYDEWVKVGMALYHTGDGDDRAFKLWNDWSSNDSRYEGNEMQRKWQSFGQRQGITVGTLYQIAKEKGWRGCITPNEYFSQLYSELVKKYGEPFQECWEKKKYKENDDNEKSASFWTASDLNERFFAALLTREGNDNDPAVFDKDENRWLQYDPNRGFYVPIKAEALHEPLDRLFLEIAKACEHFFIDTENLRFRFRTTRKLAPIIQKASGLHNVRSNFWSWPEFNLPVKNGVLDVDTRILSTHSPDFHFRGVVDVEFVNGAECHNG